MSFNSKKTVLSKIFKKISIDNDLNVRQVDKNWQEFLFSIELLFYYLFDISFSSEIHLNQTLSSGCQTKWKENRTASVLTNIGNRSIGPDFQFFYPLTSNNHDVSFFLIFSRTLVIVTTTLTPWSQDLVHQFFRVWMSHLTSSPSPPPIWIHSTIIRWPNRQFGFGQFCFLHGFFYGSISSWCLILIHEFVVSDFGGKVVTLSQWRASATHSDF